MMMSIMQVAFSLFVTFIVCAPPASYRTSRMADARTEENSLEVGAFLTQTTKPRFPLPPVRRPVRKDSHLTKEKLEVSCSLSDG